MTRFPDGERFCLHDSAVLVADVGMSAELQPDSWQHENLEPVWIGGPGVVW